MNVARKSDPEVTSNDSFWLELRVDGVARTFELDADETRAVAVGSLLRADLRIDRPGVAPVHFHIEREHDALWIVPAYGAKDLRVNAARLTGPKRLDGQAVIEFSNVRIDARILDRNSAVLRTSVVEESSAIWAQGSERQASRLFGHQVPAGDINHPQKLAEWGAILTAPIQAFYSSTEASSEHQTVSFAPIHLEPEPENPTAVVRPYQAVPEVSENESPPTLRTGQHPAVAPDQFSHDVTSGEYPTQDTIEMAPFWMAELPPEPELQGDAGARVADSISVRPILSIRGPMAQLRASELHEPQAAQMAETTYMEPLCVPDHAIADEHKSGTPSRAISDVLIVPTQASDRPGLLARIGMFSKRRPVLVWLVGTIMAFVLSTTAALVGKHLHRFAGIHQPVHGKSVTNPQMPLEIRPPLSRTQ